MITLRSKFTLGELYPWKGIWFQVILLTDDTITLKAVKYTKRKRMDDHIVVVKNTNGNPRQPSI